MSKPSHLKRWQVVLLTSLGAVGGVLLLALTEVWMFQVGSVLLFPDLYYRDIHTLEVLVEEWLGIMVELYVFPLFIVPTIAGGMLGAHSVWSWLRSASHPFRVSRACVRCAGIVLAILVPWRMFLFFTLFAPAKEPRLQLLIVLHSLLDPAIIWSLALWGWGVLLRRQAIKEGEAEQNAA